MSNDIIKDTYLNKDEFLEEKLIEDYRIISETYSFSEESEIDMITRFNSKISEEIIEMKLAFNNEKPINDRIFEIIDSIFYTISALNDLNFRYGYKLEKMIELKVANRTNINVNTLALSCLEILHYDILIKYPERKYQYDNSKIMKEINDEERAQETFNHYYEILAMLFYFLASNIPNENLMDKYIIDKFKDNLKIALAYKENRPVSKNH